MRLITLIALASSFISYSATAGSGKAIIPHWDTWTAGTYIYLSNITSHPIQVNVTFYGENGEKIAPTTYHNINNNILAPRSSGFVSTEMFNLGDERRGFGVIQWTNVENDDDTVALVAHGDRVTKAEENARSDLSIPINNGMPF
ncbi:hypothetical protein RND59_18720 [Vibrio ruber]|uniref:hypothetical protein n=1 Tax=Vibrio ruber TaxID=184755 RepID=UPI002892CE6F|nr:hypothetical protein [Vibrio ruber]WNJ97240.1 hypothetical protein RND59_18720 [Vibrio ruber]